MRPKGKNSLPENAKEKIDFTGQKPRPTLMTVCVGNFFLSLSYVIRVKTNEIPYQCDLLAFFETFTDFTQSSRLFKFQPLTHWQHDSTTLSLQTVNSNSTKVVGLTLVL